MVGVNTFARGDRERANNTQKTRQNPDLSASLEVDTVAAPAAKNCARHIRLGVFEEAIPYAVTYMTGWMDNAATACFSFHHMPTGNRAIELIANGFLDLAVVGTTPLTSAVTRGLELRSYQRVHAVVQTG